MKYSIIIPTYNHCDDLLKPCVESVIQYSRMTDVELVISANGCVDNTRSYLDELKQRFESLGFHDHIKVVWHDDALGFSRAVNAGIRASTGQRVLLLNNDVILLGQPRNQWLDRLNAPFETNPRVGITTTLKLYSPQTGRDFAVFFCTMIDRKVIDQLGLLDEAFGVGAGEDTAYCYMAEQAGYEVIGVAKTRYEPSIGTNASDFPIWHKAEGTMHDPVLVPNWHELFHNNTQLLEKMFAPVCMVDTLAQLALKFPQLNDETNPETPGLFQEVFRDNGYNLTKEEYRNKEVIDIGANVGFFSIAAAALGAHKVLSYEPVSVTYHKLIQNSHITRCDHKIHAHKMAVMGKPQAPITIGLHDRHGANSVYRVGDQSELAPVITLEQIMKQTYSHNVILKLDCEGAEFDILLDTPDHVFDRIKMIHVEIHTNLHPVYQNRDVLVNRLSHLGFQVHTSKNIGINWYDAQGAFIRWDPGHFYVDCWRKQ
jgi:FkbM family methyltransferase